MTANDFDLKKEFMSLGLNPKDRILVAYSGGGDSTFLLIEALSFFEPGNVYAAYVNYHDSEYVVEEERIVEDFISKHNVALLRKDVFLPWQTTGFEAKARDIRYLYFKEIIKSMQLKGVLVAHHANDDAETYLFQKERRGIVKNLGLAPISRIYGIDVYRPLLKLKKSDIITSLEERNIPFFDDPTNRNENRSRDRLRMGILSTDDAVETVLNEKNKLAKEHLTEIENADGFFKRKEYSYFEYRKLTEAEQRRFLFSAAQYIFGNDDNEHNSSVVNLCHEFLKSDKTGRLDLSNEISLYKNFNVFFFGKKINLSDYEFEIKNPGIYDFGPIHVDLSSPKSMHIEELPIYLKNVKKGDCIATKLEGKDAFLSMKKHHVPAYLRDVYPAIYNKDGKVIYLPFFGDQKIFIKIESILPEEA